MIAQAAPASLPTTAPKRTKAEADKLIDQAGKTPPPWWNNTPLNIPPTLDLSWKESKPWNNQKNIGQYMWDIIDPNPSRWREGVKLVQHTLSLNKGNADATHKAHRNLAQMYSEMLQDPARGAFWAKKAGDMPLTVAACYARLGCPEAAREILEELGVDDSRNGQGIKLWAEIGDLDTALQWADLMADEGYQTTAWLAAGDACRRFNKIPEAIKFYQKVLAVKDSRGDNGRNKKRAAANIEAIKLFDALDLAKIPDGTYKDISLGYVAPVEVIVTVKDKKIADLKIGAHKEKQFYASFDEVPPQIIAKQSVKGIDTTTGATITSEAIINATAKALSKAQNP
jgi:uncharacterized protein with FMN-binding domain